MLWIVAGVTLTLMFWAIGAYNRMVRLRAAALTHANALAHEIGQYLDWLVATLAPVSAGGVAMAGGPAAAHDRTWRGVCDAVSEARACWVEFQARPLDERVQGRMAQTLGLVDRLLELVIAPTWETSNHPLRSTIQQEWALYKLRQQNMSRAYNVAARACAAAMDVAPERWLVAIVRLPTLSEITLHG